MVLSEMDRSASLTVRVLEAPLMVLLVKVSVVAFPTRVSVDVGRVMGLVLTIVGLLIVGLVRVLLVKVSVVARPTKVSVELGRVRGLVLTIVPMTGLVRVLLVKVSVVARPT